MNSYLHHTISRKKILIYLKKGRVLLLLFIILSFWIEQSDHATHKYFKIEEPLSLSLSMLWNVPMIVTVLFFSLVLVPVIFKNRKYLIFWMSIIVLLLSTSFIELVVMLWMQERGVISYESLLSVIFWILKKHAIIILTTAGLLFFVEQIEEIQLLKEIRGFRKTRLDAYNKLLGTRTELPLMIQGLRSVRDLLEVDADHGRNALLSFADVLRYKLYDYEKLLVPLEEEIAMLHKLYSLSMTQQSANSIQLEIEEPLATQRVVKSSIINVLLPLLYNQVLREAQIHIHILSEESLHIWIEIERRDEEGVYKLLNLMQEQADIYGYLPIETTIESNKTTINLCLQPRR